MSVKSLLLVATLVLLQACGGGGGGSSNPPVVTPESSAAAVSSSSSSSSSSVALTSSSVSSAVSSSSSSSVASVSSSTSSLSSSSSSFSSSSSQYSETTDIPVGTADALPVLNLNTDGSAPIVSKENYINGSFSLTEAGSTTVEGDLEVRGRGNSTWGWPKKPYRLKLTHSTSLLGMPASKHWVLLANHADKTLMRNNIAFMLSKSLGMEYTVRNAYVELNLNGVYQGVYQLAEHIRVDKNRVNIPELKVGDTAADKVSGGYLLEVDFRHSKTWCINNSYESFCDGNENTLLKTDYCIESGYGMQPFCVDTPESLMDEAWTPQREYITQYINDTEAALFGVNFKDASLGYNAYLNVDSVINYFLVNEILRNVDGAVSSFYMYKKRDDKLFFGPVWDFDLAMGNAGYDDANNPQGWHIRQKPWFDRLFEDPAFTAKVKTRWLQLKAEGKLQHIIDYAEARALWLETQQQKNFVIWSVTDFDSWIQHVIQGSYDAEVRELIRWQRERLEWLDTELTK
jgi:hypothetical protein